MLVEKVERALAVDGVRPDEPFDFAAVADAELGGVEEAHLGELVGDRFVGGHAVEVAAFDHERTRGDQGGHLGVIERAAEIEFEDLVLAGPDVAVRAGDYLLL